MNDKQKAAIGYAVTIIKETMESQEDPRQDKMKDVISRKDNPTKEDIEFMREWVLYAHCFQSEEQSKVSLRCIERLKTIYSK